MSCANDVVGTPQTRTQATRTDGLATDSTGEYAIVKERSNDALDIIADGLLVLLTLRYVKEKQPINQTTDRLSLHSQVRINRIYFHSE